MQYVITFYSKDLESGKNSLANKVQIEALNALTALAKMDLDLFNSEIHAPTRHLAFARCVNEYYEQFFIASLAS